MLNIGDSVTGTVSGVTSFGAFVKLNSGETGLIHISKLSRGFVRDVQSVLSVGDEVTATVIAVNGEKIALSLIADDGSPQKQKKGDFESMLSLFKSQSSERLSGIESRQNSPRPRRRK